MWDVVVLDNTDTEVARARWDEVKGIIATALNDRFDAAGGVGEVNIAPDTEEPVLVSADLNVVAWHLERVE